MVSGMKVEAEQRLSGIGFGVLWRVARSVGPIISMVLVATGPSQLAAGVGPENVAVVVNADSNSSMQIANEYVRLRKIPAGNVIRLPEVPDAESIDVNDFRSKLLGPVLDVIKHRGLSNQIECVAWSSDFPTAINVKSDIGNRKLHKVITPVASLNGLTYLYQLVMRKDAWYLSLQVNGYARRPLTPRVRQLVEADLRRYSEAMQAATGDDKWAEAEETLRSLLKAYPRHSELHYNLACCLANSGRLDDAVEALRDAAASGWWNRRHAERDDDLQVLRGRDDFLRVLDKIDKQTMSIHASRGFRGSQSWGPDGKSVETGGMRYVLSTVLAVTRGRGTSVDEAIAYLRRSVSADNTHPKGTIYYVRNGNIRSTSRAGLFPSAVAKLKAGGVRAQIIDGTLPQKKTDVQGVMVGAASFDWKSSGSTIQPGAICEHFTSFGGVMRANAGQTPLTEFLRFGAAGSSGTVTEPYAVAAKFPNPFVHVHYAAGCGLAESFYQSITGPYQLLIVGDPLCQPWATPPHLAVDGPEPDERVNGIVTMTPMSKDNVSRFELYVDGRLNDTCVPRSSLQFDSSRLTDGLHELRIVAVASDAVEARSRIIIPVQIAN